MTEMDALPAVGLGEASGSNRQELVVCAVPPGDSNALFGVVA